MSAAHGRSPGHAISLVLPLVLVLLLNAGFYLPSTPSGVSFPGADKLYHAGVFALTVWSLARVVAPHGRWALWAVVLATSLHAPVIELVQGAMLPGRSADAADVAADLAGVAVGLAAWARFPLSPGAARSRRRRRRASHR